MDRALPPRRWLSRVTSQTLRHDAFAGFSNAAIVIPQGGAIATIAGLPPEFGLYTAMITAAIAAVVFAALRDLAAPGTARFIELALMITLLVGLIKLAAGLARLGGLVSFVSHSVMTAFTAAATVLIATSQLPGAFGVTVDGGGNMVERLHRLIESLPATSFLSLSIAGVTLATLLVCQGMLGGCPDF